MCIMVSSSKLFIAFSHKKPSRGRNFHCRRLCRRSRQGRKKVENLKKEMEIKNMKLYKENKSIIEENEKLRRRAYMLNQENQALLFQLQNSFSKICTT